MTYGIFILFFSLTLFFVFHRKEKFEAACLRLFNPVFLIFLSVLIPGSLYAQGIIPPQLQAVENQIVDALTGVVVQTLLVIVFIGSIIMWVYNKDSDKMKKNATITAVGAILLLSAQSIVKAIWTASGGQ
jgi:type IV secretory pathway VirB2 component (pilin)